MQRIQPVPARRAPVQGPRVSETDRRTLCNGNLVSRTRRVHAAKPKANTLLSAFEAELLLEWSTS